MCNMLQPMKVVRGYSVRLVNFWISLVGLVSITAFVWCFDQIDDLSAKIVVNTLSAVVAATFLSNGLSSNPERHKLSWPGVWIATVSLAGLLILIGNRADSPTLVLNSGAIISSFPALWIYYSLAKGMRLLQIWIVPIIGAALLFWITLIIPTGLVSDILLLPLPIISYLCIAWGLATKWSLAGMERMQKRTIWGPAMESLSMFLLVAPLIILAMLAVYALQVDDFWVAVSGVMVGLLFGNAVSTPLRYFLRDMIKLQWKD